CVVVEICLVRFNEIIVVNGCGVDAYQLVRLCKPASYQTGNGPGRTGNQDAMPLWSRFPIQPRCGHLYGKVHTVFQSAVNSYNPRRWENSGLPGLLHDGFVVARFIKQFGDLCISVFRPIGAVWPWGRGLCRRGVTSGPLKARKRSLVMTVGAYAPPGFTM